MGYGLPNLPVVGKHLTISAGSGIVTPIMTLSVFASFGTGTMTTMTTQDSSLGVGASPAD